MELGLLHARSIRKSEEHPALVGYSCRTCPCEGGCGDLSLWHPVWLLFTHIPLTDMGLHVFVGTIQAPGHSPVLCYPELSHASHLPHRRVLSSKGLLHKALHFTVSLWWASPFPVWCLLSPSLALPKTPRSRSRETQKLETTCPAHWANPPCLHNIRTSYS